MSHSWLALIVLALAAVGCLAGRARALRSAGGDARRLHSLPSYYGANAFLATAAPALLLLAAWISLQPIYVESRVSDLIPDAAIAEGGTRELAMADVRRIAEGLDDAVRRGAMSSEAADSLDIGVDGARERLAEAGVALGSEPRPEILLAAQRYREISRGGDASLVAIALILTSGGLAWALVRGDRRFRARIVVEKGVMTLLAGAASVAVLTTIGIVLSLIFNTWEFFALHSWTDFFFGTTWSPSFSGRGGASELGVVPLIWGTLYISLIALLVAVPIGLYAAVYLSEYAGPRARSIAKPMIEILAGIPTIVYGLFALLAVGPALVRAFGQGGALGLGWMPGGTAAMTAGLVMGIMLIPFVSSLSDDIINAVPQALRDGSLGLGATRSETIRHVVLPAALPGIVGAVLLAASRAIGETMIVVLGAGAAAKLSLNPFEAMTTVTAKIVSQLTGDADFASPEALVAFALGMTLFVITLGLNAFALYIVRKYREQYE